MKQPWMMLALSGMVLAACVAGVGGSSVRPVLNGALKVAAAPGYCLDPAASREMPDSAILLMGRCSDKAPVKPALLTLSVGEAGSASVMAAGGAELAAFFTSREGLATLSPRGRASDVRVVSALSAGDAFLMRLREADGAEYWRAVLGVRGRLLTVSVKGTAESVLAPDEGRAILDGTVAALQRVNPAQ
jgi:hypothetical protein